MPIIIFHGDKDNVIAYDSSIKLKELFKQTDKLITLKGQRHNGMSNNMAYLIELGKLLPNRKFNSKLDKLLKKIPPLGRLLSSLFGIFELFILVFPSLYILDESSKYSALADIIDC